MTGRGYVDYEAGARRYRAGREPSASQTARWRTAIRRRLPAGPLDLVVDGGCGTGAFLGLWRSVGAERILAVDPSPAMRELASTRQVAGVTVVAGELAAIPAPSRRAAVVWVSAVLHHVEDPRAALREIERVLGDDGRLMIRGFVPGSSRIPWLDHMPGADRATRRFPGIAEITSLAHQAGLVVDAVDVVADGAGVAAPAVSAWIDQMRDTDSLLTALSPDEIDSGRRAIEAHGGTLDPVALSLVTIRRPGKDSPAEEPGPAPGR